MEDRSGRHFPPDSAPLAGPDGTRRLSDTLGPGESFRVQVPYRLPVGGRPAGLVVHHGDFPGAVIIGEDAAFSHRAALLRLE